MNTPQWDTVAVVGVGMIGASIGLALRKRNLAHEVVGVGRRMATLDKAKELGAIDRATTSVERGVAVAQLVVVCTPVASIPGRVKHVREACPPDCLITDAGSTKIGIVAELERELPEGTRYIGSHPMAGSENSGPEFGEADLFQDRLAIVTPTRRTRAADVAAIEAFWQSLDARVLRMSPLEHDRAVAVASHLPHLISSAVAGSTAKEYLPIVATGWMDTTRIAGGDPELWEQILIANREHVLEALTEFEQYALRMRQALEAGNGYKLKNLLAKAKRTRDALGS